MMHRQRLTAEPQVGIEPTTARLPIATFRTEIAVSTGESDRNIVQNPPNERQTARRNSNQSVTQKPAREIQLAPSPARLPGDATGTHRVAS